MTSIRAEYLWLCCCFSRSWGSPPTPRSASGWRIPRHYNNHRPQRKPSLPALPLQARRGSALMPLPKQQRPRPERHTLPPPNPAWRSATREDRRGRPEGRAGGGPPRPHTQGKPPVKIPTTPHPNLHSRETPNPFLGPPTFPLRSTDVFKKGNISQGYSILISQNHQSQTNRGRLLFWIRACRQKALYCACRAPFHSFYSIYLLFFFYFSFISPFLFLL